MPSCIGYLVTTKVLSRWYPEVQKNLAVFKDHNEAEAFIAQLKADGPVNFTYEIEAIKIVEVSNDKANQ